MSNSTPTSSGIDWQALRNPVLSYPEWSIKDACMVCRDGVFHVFFSAFNEERSTIAKVETHDFRTFSPFTFHWTGQAEGWIGLCSPDVVRADGRYVMSFNSWGDNAARPNQLFYATSPDLRTWSPGRPLARELTEGARTIDAALAFSGGRWFLAFKSIGGRLMRMAMADDLDGPWVFVGDGLPKLLMTDGRENGLTHENYQFLTVNGVWHLLSTDYKPHHPYLYRISGDGSGRDPGDWLTWIEGRRLEVPVESWGEREPDNAAALCGDLLKADGFHYMIYAGKNDERIGEFMGTASGHPWARGWERLGLARSRDLVTWAVSGR